jgi:ribosome maturation factor RimP
MSDSSPRDTIYSLAAPQAAAMGLEIWGIEVQSAAKSLVRVYVEGPEGVDIEQCAELSRLLGLALEVEDAFSGPYVLEISSPGLERIFFTEAQLALAVGKRVDLTLIAALPEHPGRKRFKGALVAFADGLFALKAEDMAPAGEEPPLVRFAFAQTRKVRQIHFDPEPAPKPGKGVKKTASAPARTEPAE